MPFRFDVKKANNVILFAIHSMGGMLDLSRLFLILYLADLKHLSKNGSLITGDTYIAMKYGPVPFHILSIYKQMKEQTDDRTDVNKLKVFFTVNDQLQAVAQKPYDKDYLAASEVECLFETLQQHKNDSLEELCTKTTIGAWLDADINGEISLESMSKESGASEEMINYIKMNYSDEIKSFSNEL